MAKDGASENYLSSIKIKYDNTEWGNGPSGLAIKTKEPVVIKDTQEDPRYAPWKNQALKNGFLSSAAIPLIYLDEVIGMIGIYSMTKDGIKEQDINFLKGIAEDIAIGLKILRTEIKLQNTNESLNRILDKTIETISAMCEVRDPYTAGHQYRVSKLSSAITREMGYSEWGIRGIEIASYFMIQGKYLYH